MLGPTPSEYPRSKIRSLPPAEIDALLSLDDAELADIAYTWDFRALPHQRRPKVEHDTWIHIGGRGSGKTTAATEAIREDVYAGVRRFNFIGRTAASIRDDMVQGEAGIIAAFPPRERPEYISSQSCVRFHTGAEALLLTAEEPLAIQGKNCERAWLDEFSTYARPEDVWSQISLACRVGEPRKYVTTNSLPDCPFLDKLVSEAAERRIAVTRSTSFDNYENLPEQYQREVEQMMRTAWGRAWILGEKYKPEGALWHEDWIQYLPAPPPGGRTVVAVDPSGTERGDETGIIVARRVGDLGYVCEDLSGHHDAEVWPKLVVDAAHRWGAKAIVIERNRGLDFLRALIRPHDRHIRLDEINVTNKKDDRAYPIANLYELKRIFHCPMLPQLEKQMLNWDPSTQETQRAKRKASSPDRIDALVHAIAWLGFHVGSAPTFMGGLPAQRPRVPR